MQPSDDELISRAQQGDRQAYMLLFDRNYGRVESYARWQLGDRDRAADIASETFARAYRSLARFRTGHGVPYLAYLLQICRRLIYQERGRMRHEASPLTDADLEHPGDDQELPLVHVLEEEQREMIQTALRLLAEPDREIIVLAFERELSRRDIATVMGKPSVSAVTSHLHRAMQKLRAVIMKQGYFHAPHSVGGR